MEKGGSSEPGREHQHVQLVAAAAGRDRGAAAAAACGPAAARGTAPVGDPGQRGRLDPHVAALQRGVVVIGERDPLAADLVMEITRPRSPRSAPPRR